MRRPGAAVRSLAGVGELFDAAISIHMSERVASDLPDLFQIESEKEETPC